ncbi:MAG: hypothetical protein BGO92_10360 [Magnetospirillum sp. 64-120]|nr:MAG: hypothetical protein BGO92_10360 [Magnetospirillum sp. 64-120]
MNSSDKSELRKVAEDSIRKSQAQREDSPTAVMRAVRAVMCAHPGVGEAEAFDLVWSLWPTDARR